MDQMKLQIKATNMDEDFIKKLSEITFSAMQQFRIENQLITLITNEINLINLDGIVLLEGILEVM
ncbi:unnamed protein product [Paramecium octaurelia]|uniref:Uncharacterized protein n=1 Tax=Paramecium octaurelia TaxID=43137 RepID=A0A8S1UAF7_PAROT|nr:unnamed protein product [Paramecium octaurelia]